MEANWAEVKGRGGICSPCGPILPSSTPLCPQISQWTIQRTLWWRWALPLLWVSFLSRYTSEADTWSPSYPSFVLFPVGRSRIERHLAFSINVGFKIRTPSISMIGNSLYIKTAGPGSQFQIMTYFCRMYVASWDLHRMTQNTVSTVF